MYYTFNQNNSGGSFRFDETHGITHFVIIEANSVSEACERAESIGIYFNGCEDGRDCDCCGDRWSTPWNEDGSEYPEVYGKNPRESTSFKQGWMKDGKETCIHPLNGMALLTDHYFGTPHTSQ